MVLAKEMKALKEMKESYLGVLSIYLSTSSEMRNKWKILLKNEFKEIQAILSKSNNLEELKSFLKLRDMVDKTLADSRGVLQRSVIIFASETNRLFEVHYLPIFVDPEVHWSPKPKLHQLEKIQSTFPNTGIILTNRGAITVINTMLGEIDIEVSYELNIDTNDWKKFQGRSARSSSQQDKFQKRMDENLEKYYREVAAEVRDLKDEWNWSRVVVIGESDQANYFSSVLNTKPEKIIYKNLKKATNGEILRTAFEE